MTLGSLAYLGVVLVAPLTLLVRSAWPFTLAPVESRALVHSLSAGLGMAAVLALLGTALALLLARTVAPALLLALLLVGRASLARGVLGLGFAPGPLAAGLSLLFDLLPFAAILLGLRLRSWPRALDDTIADLGGGSWERLRTVAWPHLRPGLLVIGLWISLQVLGDVIAFESAGGGHLYTPGLLVRDALVREAAFARGLAGILFMLALALICAWMFARELDAAGRIDWRPLPPASLGLRALGWGMFALMLAVPLAASWGPRSTGFGPRDAALLALAGRSLGLALTLALLSATLGLALALLCRGLPQRGRSWIALALLTPLAIPPSVLGLLALQLAAALGLRPGLTLTVLGLLGPCLALAFICLRLAVMAIPAGLSDAAADLGADARERLRLLWLPAMQPALLAVVLVVTAWVLAQAAIPSFSSGPGGDTLAVALTIHARAGDLELVRRWSSFSLAVPALALLALATLSAARTRRPA